MKKLAGFVYDHSRLIMAFVIIVNLVALASFIRFKIDTDFLAFFTEGNPEAAAYHELNDKYQSGEVLSVLVESETPLLDKDNLLEVYRLQQEMGAVAGVARVQGFIPPDVPVSMGVTATVDAAYIEAEYASLRDFIANEYFMTEQFLAADGQSAAIIVSLAPGAPADEIIDKLEAIGEGRPLSLALAGNEVIKATMWDYLVRILLFLPPAEIILVLGVFYLMLRNRLFTVLSMVPAGLAALWIFGTIFWSGQQLNLVTVLTPLFIIVIGSAYGLHYVSHFRDNLAHYTDRRELTVATLGMVGTPILLATLTTMAGFVSLVWTEVVPMRQMGIFVTLGIGYAGFMALFFLPAVLSRMKLPATPPPAQEGFLSKLVLAASRQRALVLIVFVAIVAVSAAFIPRLHVVSDQLMFFKENSEIRQTFSRVEAHFGGAMPMTGEIIAPEGRDSLNDAAFAAEVLAAERELEALPGVKSAFSVFDLISGINKMATGQEGYPDNPMLAGMILGQVSDEDLAGFVSDDGLRVMVRTEGLTSEDIAAIKDFTAENSDVWRNVTGMPVLFDEMNRLVVQSQVQSLGLALVLIFLVLWVTLRRITAALAGLLPIVITIAAILGMLSMTGFQLNVMTANLSAIAIGVGVDYSIHLISGIYYYRGKGQDRLQSVNTALTTVSRPVLTNAIGLAIGLSALFFSPLRIHMQAASVMWVAMIVSSLAALLLVPVFYRGRRRTS